MYSLPTSIKLGEKEFKIRNDGDFRMVLDCFSALSDFQLSDQERFLSCLIIFYEDLNDITDLSIFPDINEAVNQMNIFFNCGQEETVGMRVNYKLIDWDKDSNIICSAINNVARTEIRALPYLHWWTFMGYYLAVGDSLLSNIVSIRSKIAKGKKLEKYEQEFKKENPQYFNFDYRLVQERSFEEQLKANWKTK